MGWVVYDDLPVRFDDRVVAHLEVVIVQRLRTGRSFTMSWIHETAAGLGRTSVWLHPEARLRFVFEGSREPRLDTAWVDRLGRSADGSRGLIVADPAGSLIREFPPVR